MSDPIEKLTRLGEALEGAPMPLPASEIRARGDRIRRRKHAVIAGASAAVVAAVAVPVVALTLNNGDDDQPPVTPRPTITDSNPVPSAALSEENLLTDEQAIYPNGGSDWRVRDTYPGDGQSAFNPCTQKSMAGLGAEKVFQRDFDFVVLPSEEIEPTLHLNEIIAEFPTAADAEAAADTIQGWLQDCLPPGADTYGAGNFNPVPIGVDGTAAAQVSTYGPVDESIDPFGDFAYFLETGLAVSGDRLAVLTQIVPGQDYNWEEGTPVEQMLPDAAQQLALGNETPAPAEPSDGTGSPTLSDDFPLTSGWPEDDGSSEFELTEPSEDNQAVLAAGDLEGCQEIDGGDPADRLTARLSVGSSSYVREIQVFADDGEAAAYLDSIQDAYSACEAEGPTTDGPPFFTTEVNDGSLGGESSVITRASDGIGRTVINVVRVGNAVTVDLASDEGTGDTVGDLATVTRENLADVIAAMYGLQGGGSSGSPGPDPSDPAGVTTIPDGFPLDLALAEPPFEDADTTVDGPGADSEGARALTMCGQDLSFPNTENADPNDSLGYSVSTIEGYDGRTIRAYPTAQDAVDQMDLLRSQIQGCDRDNGGDGLSDRLFRTFSSATGYDSITFGWHYEATEFQPAGAGEVYTVIRVGNAVLTISWGAEWSAESMADAAPNQVELTRLIAAEMCVFTVDGC